MNHIAKASTEIAAPANTIWRALTDPAAIKQYYFGTNLSTDWKKGSPITWKGEWQGQHYEDRGVVLGIEPPRLMRYSHFSPLMGKPDRPENYHHITIALADAGTGTRVTLEQDNNASEEARAQSESNWRTVLEGLKKYVEGV